LGIMLPSRLVGRAYALRGFRIWLVTRAHVTAVFLLGGEDAVRLPFGSVVELVLLTVALCFLDMRRRRERTLLGNLALGSGSLSAFFAGPAVFGELLIRVVATLA
jgi:hypothetical protein